MLDEEDVDDLRQQCAFLLEANCPVEMIREVLTKDYPSNVWQTVGGFASRVVENDSVPPPLRGEILHFLVLCGMFPHAATFTLLMIRLSRLGKEVDFISN